MSKYDKALKDSRKYLWRFIIKLKIQTEQHMQHLISHIIIISYMYHKCPPPL